MSTVFQVKILCKSCRCGAIGGGTLRADFSHYFYAWR